MLIFFNLSLENNAQIQALSPADLDDLLSKIAQDDQDAFITFYQATQKTLYAYILSLCGNFADAQDLLHDTYLKIRAGAHLYQSQGKPLAWVFTIAKNLTYMKFRSQSNQPHISWEEQNNFQGPSQLNSIEDTLVLREAMQILSEQERQIVFLHAVSGLKHREIAANLQMPLATVLSKYTRSLGKLRKHLRQQGVTL